METLRDLVIVIPGITGSILEKDSKVVWGWSAGSLIRGLATGGATIRSLALSGDDPELDSLDDGVIATKLIPDAHLIPGFWKIDGYSVLRDLVTGSFAIQEGDPRHVAPANYFEFPYDWRRDNRVAARALGRLVDEALPLWRQHSGAADAKVIILAHSMGGLVARYWLEVDEGWRKCRALITYGTPFRGAPKAIGYLANGYKMLFDLSETMRSFTSVYQLLPIYPAIHDASGEFVRVAECDAHPRIDRGRAEEALRFHRKIEQAVTDHRNDPAYLTLGTGYRILPVVGVSQPTIQSAFVDADGLQVAESLPTGVDPVLAAGDGTVPRVSATPIELSQAFAETFIADKHAALQGNRVILDNLRQQLMQMQARDQGAVRGPAEAPERVGETALALSLEDLYVAGEPVEISVDLRRVADATLMPMTLAKSAPRARITPADSGQGVVRREFRPDGNRWVLDASDLPAGLYRVEVRLADPLVDGSHPSAVHDIFGIGENTAGS